MNADFATVIPIRQKPAISNLTFAEGTRVEYQDVQIDLEDYAAVLFRLSNGAPGSFTTCQAVLGRKSDIEIQVYGSRCSFAWDHSNSNRLWIGHRGKPNEIAIEAAVPLPETAAYTPLPAGHPLGYQDAILNLFKDFYEDVNSEGHNLHHPHPRPTFRSGMDAMRILDWLIRSSTERRWINL